MTKTATRLVVGISGATGSVYGVRLLELLHNTGVETHLVLSKWGARTLIHETAYSVEQVQQMATRRTWALPFPADLLLPREW